MNAIETTVFIIDDDKAVRTAIRNLLESVGIRVETFNSPQDFLKADHKNVPGCLVLDVRLQGTVDLIFKSN